MRTADSLRLLLLAAIWGGSFIFMRFLSPVLGPVITAEMRVLIAGIAMSLFFVVTKFDPEWRRFWKEYLVIGAVNSAIPFFFYAFAALHIQGSLSAIMNSTSPLFGAIFSAIWLSDKLTFKKILGLLIGALGVALVVKIGTIKTDPMFTWSILACTGAAICYGLAAVFIKKHAKSAKSVAIAGCSQVTAAIVLLPAVPFSPLKGDITLLIAVAVIIFSLLCNAVGYLLYYRLLADVGPTKALTVTFLMPVFGMIWGVIFLSETITISMIAGAALIILGSSLVLNVLKLPHPAPSS